MDKENRLKIFFEKCKRVWYVLKKPSKKEYTLIVKVTAIGIAVIGFFGFLISVLMKAFV
ncbi:MAG: hypothetical protein KatS3mg001_415 [Candidatus Pacearchaeota archaeon]|nr:MAG: hypothetical protein KatS3mg001_415 [Candidatus Pacearchaeota archaeon]